MNQFVSSTENFYLPISPETCQYYAPFFIPSYQQFMAMNTEISLNYLPTFNFPSFSEQRLLNEAFSNESEASLQKNSFPTRQPINKKQKMRAKQQRKGRNIISNIFRSFLRYLNSKDFLENDLKKLTTLICKEKFSQKLETEFSNFQSYIRKKQIVEFLFKTISIREEPQFCRVMRALLLFYIRNVHITTIYSSRKIETNFRSLHFKKLRSFERKIIKFYAKAQSNIKNKIGQECFDFDTFFLFYFRITG